MRRGGGSLPETFDGCAVHKLRLEKNHDLFRLWIDHLHVAGLDRIQARFDAPGRPGLFSKEDSAAFDAVLYTSGWDEWGEYIRGWREIEGEEEDGEGPLVSGGKEGLVLEGHKNKRAVVKGDAWCSYDAAVQVKALERKRSGRMGVYAVYVDEENYLAIWIQEGRRRLSADGKRSGKALPAIEASLPSVSGSREGPSYNLRVVKLRNNVLVFVDGEPCLEIPGFWPASRVGLGAQRMTAIFDGITVFRLEREPAR